MLCAHRLRDIRRTRSHWDAVQAQCVHHDCPVTLSLPRTSQRAPDLAAAELLGNKLRRLELPRARSMADVRAPRAGRQYRVARAGETEYRRVTDRYHNHTSPLIASTCWIKHSASLPRAVTPSKLIQVHFTLNPDIKQRSNFKSTCLCSITSIIL